MVLSRRLTILALCIAFCGLAAGGLYAQLESGDRGILPIDSSGTLEITGIKVDVGGKTAAEARFNGWRIAQREGFKALWAKQHRRPISEAPTLSDGVLDTLVSSIIVEKEQIGPNRYIAQLGILFDRARAGEMLGFSGLQRRSAAMMLIPVFQTAGTQTTVERRNLWQRAWAQFRTSQSPIDYVRVSGMGPDPLLINAAQTRRPGRAWWRNVLDYYGAADILTAEVTVHRAYPGGPAVARFVGRHGADGTILGGFTLRAKDSADLPRMMAEGVERMDQLFTNALAAGLLVRDTSLITVEPPPPVEEELPQAEAPPARLVQIQVITPNEQVFASVVGEVRGVPGVVSVTPRSTAIGGWSLLLVNYRGSNGALGGALQARGWNVAYVGPTIRLTPAVPSAPLAQPQPQPAQPSQQPSAEPPGNLQ